MHDGYVTNDLEWIFILDLDTAKKTKQAHWSVINIYLSYILSSKRECPFLQSVFREVFISVSSVRITQKVHFLISLREVTPALDPETKGGLLPSGKSCIPALSSATHPYNPPCSSVNTGVMWVRSGPDLTFFPPRLLFPQVTTQIQLAVLLHENFCQHKGWDSNVCKRRPGWKRQDHI